MSDQPLIDRLLAHRTIGGVPREQLEWLANMGHLLVLEPGDILTKAGTPVTGVFVVLEGYLSIRVDHGAGSRIVMEWHGGDCTGILPYSRMKTGPGNVVAETRSEIFALDREHIPRMIRECYDLTAVLVHVMLDRARVFKSSELLDEKMVSLGRLAAGLAHELNNPASAVARSAKALVSELDHLDDARRQLTKLNMSDTQLYSIGALKRARDEPGETPTPLEIADREEALSDWLDEHGVADVEVRPLATMAYEPADLQMIHDTVGDDRLGTVLSHMSSESTVRQLAAEIQMAATRIHALVAAVKGFTYMGQQAALQPVEIGRGLADTITILGAKARSKQVDVQLEVAPGLPLVDGYGGELNQVWGNLLDNAIDATPKGHVKVSACVELGKVVVRIIDDGPGIKPEVLHRIYDPFFTTKPVGEGTGLGLDIARRIVQRHHAEIDVTSSERGTEFRVTFPEAAAASAPSP